jgi:hypothetical protein
VFSKIYYFVVFILQSFFCVKNNTESACINAKYNAQQLCRLASPSILSQTRPTGVTAQTQNTRALFFFYLLKGKTETRDGTKGTEKRTKNDSLGLVCRPRQPGLKRARAVRED